MPLDANFIGGMSQGITQAQQIQQQRALQKAQLDIANKEFKLREEKDRLAIEQTKAQMDLMTRFINGAIGGSPTPQPQAGMSPLGTSDLGRRGEPDRLGIGSIGNLQSALPSRLIPPAPTTTPKPTQAPTGQTIGGIQVPGGVDPNLVRMMAATGNLQGALGLLKPPAPPSVGADLEAISSANFGGRRFSALTPDEQKKAIEIQSAEKLKRGPVAAEKLKFELEQGRPIEADKIQNWINPDTLASPQFGVSSKQAASLGFRNITDKQKSDLIAATAARDVVAPLKVAVNNVIQSTGGMDAFKQGFKLNWEAFTRTNPMARFYVDAKASTLGILARSLGGEKGVLTDRDIARIAMWLPSFFDSAEVRDLKINSIDFLIKRAYERQKNIIFGIQENEGAYRKQVDMIFNGLAQQAPNSQASMKEVETVLGEVMGEREIENRRFLLDPNIFPKDREPSEKAENFYENMIKKLGGR